MKNSNEYLMIREELMWRLKSIDSLSTFTYTVFVTIIGIAFVNVTVELFILPYLIIIPMSLKVANHKYVIGMLSVYLLRLEDDKESYFKWEKYKLENSSNKITKNKLIYLGSNMD